MNTLDSSFLQTSEKLTEIGKGFSCWWQSICFAAVQKSAFCTMCRKASGNEECVTAESSAVSAWKRRVKLCPGQRGRSTAWWMWMGYNIANSEFLTGYPSNTQGTGLRRDRNTVWYLKEIQPSAGIFWVSEHTFCESAGCHPTPEYYAITCHIQPAHCWFIICIKINHMKFRPKESAIKQRII